MQTQGACPKLHEPLQQLPFARQGAPAGWQQSPFVQAMRSQQSELCAHAPPESWQQLPLSRAQRPQQGAESEQALPAGRQPPDEPPLPLPPPLLPFPPFPFPLPFPLPLPFPPPDVELPLVPPPAVEPPVDDAAAPVEPPVDDAETPLVPPPAVELPLEDAEAPLVPPPAVELPLEPPAAPDPVELPPVPLPPPVSAREGGRTSSVAKAGALERPSALATAETTNRPGPGAVKVACAPCPSSVAGPEATPRAQVTWALAGVASAVRVTLCPGAADGGGARRISGGVGACEQAARAHAHTAARRQVMTRTLADSG